MFTDNTDTMSHAKHQFDNELFSLRRDAQEIRTLNAHGRHVEKWTAVRDILHRTGDLEGAAAVRAVVHDEHLWHNLNEVIRSKANLALITTDPAINDQLDSSIRKLEQVFDHEFSEASDHTE